MVKKNKRRGGEYECCGPRGREKTERSVSPNRGFLYQPDSPPYFVFHAYSSKYMYTILFLLLFFLFLPFLLYTLPFSQFLFGIFFFFFRFKRKKNAKDQAAKEKDRGR